MSSGRGGKRGKGAARGSQKQSGACRSQSKGTKQSVESKLSDQLARTTLKENGAIPSEMDVFETAEEISLGGATKYESTTKPNDSPKQKQKHKEKIPSALKGSEEGATKCNSTTEIELLASPGYLPPNRPSYGTLGRTLKVLINFFPIQVPNITIHQYDVKIYNINPEGATSVNSITNKYVCRMVMGALCS